MKSGSVLVNSLSVGVLLMSVLVYRSWQKAREPVKREMFRDDFKQQVGWHPPHCKHPMVYRNALNFGEYEQCKKDESNPCVDLIKQRMIDLFGDGYMEAFHKSHISNHDKPQSINWPSQRMQLRDYFTKPEYSDYVVHTLHQLGNSKSYRKFLSFERDVEPTFYDLKRMNPRNVYLGSQFFLAQGKNTGSNLHFAFGQNDFIMLAGRKRWLMLDPAYMYDATCRLGFTGVYGTCHPGYPDHEYVPAFANVSIDHYRTLLIDELGIPEEAIFDVTLNPGDMLINCAQWAHTIQNMDETTVAFSVRSGVRREYRTPQMWAQVFEGLFKAIYTKLFVSWDKYTLLDAGYRRITGTDEAYLDEDERFSGHSFINSKNETSHTDDK